MRGHWQNDRLACGVGERRRKLMAIGTLFKSKRSGLASLRSSYAAFLCTLSVPNKAAAALADIENDNDPAFGARKQDDCNDALVEVDDEQSDGEDAANRKWKRLKGPECGIYHGHIPKSAWNVLQTLKENGFGAYLVGGCLRDAMLKQTPKDFDVITTAELRQVKKAFNRCMIVGKQFPVCHVNTFGGIVEVSSFSTNAARANIIKSLKYSSEEFFSKDDMLRWQNTMKRDFTINGFIYDPFDRILYDYVGGLVDLEKKKVRTIISPYESFREDPARLLRGVRIAARLGFRFSKETSQAVKAHKYSLTSINQARLMQEINTMMVYGAAAPSLRLLWKYDYLDAMLPVQAAYFERSKLKRTSKPRRNLLTDLLTVLDKFVTPDQPCHTTMWVAVLALQLALEEKRSHLGVTAALLAIRHQNMNVAIGELNQFESMLKGGEVTVNESYFERSFSMDENSVVAEALQIIQDGISGLQQMHGQHENEPTAHGTLISRMTFAKALKLFQGGRDRVRTESLCSKRAGTEYLRKQAFTEGADAEVVYVLSCIFLNILYPATQKGIFLFK